MKLLPKIRSESGRLHFDHETEIQRQLIFSRQLGGKSAHYYFQKANELNLDSTSISIRRLAHLWGEIHFKTILKHILTSCDKRQPSCMHFH